MTEHSVLVALAELRIKQAEQRLSNARQALVELNGRIQVYCEGCTRSYPIRKLTFGRDYWFENEAYNERLVERDTHYVKCVCGAVSRLKSNDPEIMELNKLSVSFKEVVNLRDGKWPNG